MHRRETEFPTWQRKRRKTKLKKINKRQRSSTKQADSEDRNRGRKTKKNECSKLKIDVATMERQLKWPEKKRRGRRLKNKKKTLPAAADSAANESSGVFMKKRHTRNSRPAFASVLVYDS